MIKSVSSFDSCVECRSAMPRTRDATLEWDTLYHLYSSQTFRSIRKELFYKGINLDEKEVLIKAIKILKKGF
jgi:hypothetical protein